MNWEYAVHTSTSLWATENKNYPALISLSPPASRLQQNVYNLYNLKVFGKVSVRQTFQLEMIFERAPDGPYSEYIYKNFGQI